MMFFDAVSVGFWSLSGILGLFALRAIIKGTWFWSIFRAIGLGIVVCCSAFFGLLGWDFKNYKDLNIDQSIAHITFNKVAPQTYVATLTRNHTGEQAQYYLLGDQWQVDARIIRWASVGQLLGAKPGYRLDRISGRYLSTDDEIRKNRSVYSLLEQDAPIDFWAYAYKGSKKTPIFEASYGSATYLPMADGAEFDIKLSATGLLATPANEVAQTAVQVWLN